MRFSSVLLLGLTLLVLAPPQEMLSVSEAGWGGGGCGSGLLPMFMPQVPMYQMSQMSFPRAKEFYDDGGPDLRKDWDPAVKNGTPRKVTVKFKDGTTKEITAYDAIEASDYQWRRIDDEETALWQGNTQIGNLKDGKFFRRLGPGQWDETPSDPPIDPPGDASQTGAIGGKKCGCSKDCTCKKNKCTCKPGKRCNEKCKCTNGPIGGDDKKDDKPTVKGLSTKLPGCACTGEETCSCPLDCKCQEGCIKNFGLDTKKISPRERYTLNGEELSKEEVQGAISRSGGGRDRPNIGNDKVPDDTNKPLVIFISDNKSTLTTMKQDMASPTFKAFKDATVQQYYDATDPKQAAMLKCGLPTTGTHVLVEDSKGNVLWDTQGTAYQGTQTIQQVSQAPYVVQEVRKIDPNYNSANNPGPIRPNNPNNPNSPSPLLGGDGLVLSPELLALGFLMFVGVTALALVLVVTKRGN